MVENVIIINQKALDKKIKQIAEDGASKLHILSDFDRTITKGLSGEGKRTATVISQLRSDPKYLGEDYQKEAHRLYDTYRPIEIDMKLPLAEKKKEMHDWWMRHFNLIARVGLTRDLIKLVVKEKPLSFREGSLEFLSLLNENKIPVVFMSAAPGDMLNEYLRANKLLLRNVYVISNLYEFDSKGRAIKIREPIIHTFNKDETSIKGFPVYDEIKNRKNVILLGDEIGDIGMVDGFEYNKLIKIGFLNEDVDKNLNLYKKNFDVIILNDGNMDYVNKLLGEILKR
jgi:5'-nucleotidase